MRLPWHRAPVPDAPLNVRLRYPDGREVPCEVVYRGQHNGIHEWAVVSARMLLVPGVELRCERLPGRTSITIDAVPEP